MPLSDALAEQVHPRMSNTSDGRRDYAECLHCHTRYVLDPTERDPASHPVQMWGWWDRHLKEKHYATWRQYRLRQIDDADFTRAYDTADDLVRDGAGRRRRQLMETHNFDMTAARVRLSQVIDVGVVELSPGVHPNEFMQWCFDAVLNQREDVNRDEADAVLATIYTDKMREMWWNTQYEHQKWTPAELWSQSAAGRYQIMDIINDLVKKVDHRIDKLRLAQQRLKGDQVIYGRRNAEGTA